jgi:Ca2+-binding RTX toxin-like protein
MTTIDFQTTFADDPRPASGGSASGRAGAQLLRLAPAAYDDFGQTLAGSDRPGAREISNAVFAQTGDRPNPQGASSLLWVWGQFLDHDIARTPGNAAQAGTAPIPVPTGDPVFDPGGVGGRTIAFSRSGFIGTTGDDEPREFRNFITAFLDGSQLYGSSQAELDALLEPGGAKLRLSADGLILFNGNAPVAGDARAAENVALLSLHALFAREHNRFVDELVAANDAAGAPPLSVAAQFEGARARVEAILQAVTYDEFLPTLLGVGAIPDYAGFKSGVSAQMSIEFTTAMYRVGHTLLSPVIRRMTEAGDAIDQGDLALRDAFFSQSRLAQDGGVDPILRGMATTRSQAVDTFIVEDVRSFLSLGPGGAGGFDLAALNIQRGRDHGLPSYVAMRAALGLAPKTTFAQITDDPQVAARLAAVYGTVDKIDLWVGGLAETPLPGGMVGELFSVVMIEQFARLRDGDPFWSEGRGFSAAEKAALWSTTLSDVIRRNSGVLYLQDQALAAFARVGGDEGNDTLSGGAGRDLVVGFDGDDQLNGLGGADHLFGADGADRLDGGLGADTMEGGLGSDVYVVDNPGDVVRGETPGAAGGVDTVRATVSFALPDHVENLVLVGPAATLGVGNAGDNRIEAGAAPARLEGLDGSDTLVGGTGRDTLVGGDGADSLLGGDGSDNLSGGDGGDTLLGGNFWDRLNGGAGDDLLVGGAQDDTVSYLGAPTGVVIDLNLTGPQNTVGWGVDTIREVENVFGTGFADTVIGNGANSRLEGEGGDDLLNGGPGGNDTLIGGAGADTLIGGFGFDVFVFLSVAHSTPDAPDVLRSVGGAVAFSGPGAAQADLIDVSAVDADESASGVQDFVFGLRGAGGLFTIDDATSTATLLLGNVDDDPAAEFVVRIEDGATRASAYSAADFLV